MKNDEEIGKIDLIIIELDDTSNAVLGKYNSLCSLYQFMSETNDVHKVILRLQHANRLMESLIDLSMEDSTMSEDEKNILFSINTNMQQYAEEIMRSISDGKISKEELQKLSDVENKIINDAQLMAERDSNVTENERKMLEELVSSIRDISSI